jgi:hypothetical protein
MKFVRTAEEVQTSYESATMLGYADLAFLRNFKGLQKADDYWLCSDKINEVKRHHLENRPCILSGREIRAPSSRISKKDAT